MKIRSALILILVVSAFMSGCAKTSYVGKTYAPTDNVDLFLDETSVTRPYEVMGQVSIDGESLVSTDKLQQKMLEEAKARGANAVLIEDYKEIYTDSSTSTNASTSTDKKGNQHYHGNSYTSQSKRKILKAQFLKYTD
jgi:hypothetical protein